MSKDPGAIASSILVADDDSSILKAIAAMLEALGHTVTESRDGRAAWDRLRHGEQYALIVTDVSMPRMSGLDLLAAVRDARLKTPVVVVSGDPRNRASALLGGARRFLDKPFRLEALEAAVRSALCDPFRDESLLPGAV